jgi:hypothetical protein
MFFSAHNGEISPYYPFILSSSSFSKSISINQIKGRSPVKAAGECPCEG